MVSVCSPLELTIISHAPNLTIESLGECLKKQINLLRSRSFEAKRVLVDPHKSLMALVGGFPGTVIDACGAGDHLDKVDAKMRRIKEMMRSIIAGLPYSLPRARVKDLATYVVSRINTRRTTASSDSVCPRVKFTGVKIDYKNEFGLAFGDYVEAYNPRAEQQSNNIYTQRTEPCIALYPSANKNGSWVLYNLRSKTYMRRAQWKKLPVSEVVIAQMTESAGPTAVEAGAIDVEANEVDEEPEPPSLEPQTHVPNPDVIAEGMTVEEAEMEEEDGDMPGLIDPDAEDSDDEDEQVEEGARDKEQTLGRGSSTAILFGVLPISAYRTESDHLE
jgi:hypothetical protein